MRKGKKSKLEAAGWARGSEYPAAAGIDKEKRFLAPSLMCPSFSPHRFTRFHTSSREISQVTGN